MGNRLSKIYTKTGDDGGHDLMSQSRASCAGCSEHGETRGFRHVPTGACRRLRAGILPAWPCR
jgi:hypothetical protein